MFFFNITSITGMENLNTSQVTDMEGMFEFCDQLTSLEVSRFDTRKVLDFDIMFKDCQKIESLDVSRFNTSEAIDMEGMFANCLKIKSLDLWHFDTRKVERMSCLFYMCVALKTIYCRDSWTCRSSEDMFKNCFSLRGAIAYDESKTNAKYANPSTGYFTNYGAQNEAYKMS